MNYEIGSWAIPSLITIAALAWAMFCTTRVLHGTVNKEIRFTMRAAVIIVTLSAWLWWSHFG